MLINCVAYQEGKKLLDIATGDIGDHVRRPDFLVGVPLHDAITIGPAIHVNLSMVTIKESETTKRLAAWAAILAVFTATAGIRGMNFEHMPELKWAYGCPLALGLIAAAAGLLHWGFRRAGWL